MSIKQRKIIAIILVVVLIVTSLGSGLAIFLKSSYLLAPELSDDIVSGKTYVVTNRFDEKDVSEISFEKNNKFIWNYDKKNNFSKTGEYHVYTGVDIQRIFNENKETEGFTKDDVKAMKQAVQSFVDEGIVKNVSDVVYIKIKNIKDNNPDSVYEELIFFGTRIDNNNLNLKEIISREMYSFVAE